MENKINVAELLKKCPKGMELDCTLFNNPVTLEEVTIDFTRYPIVIKLKSDDLMTLTEYGCYNHVEDSKCVIFPKGKTTWEGFVPPCEFKVGDNIRRKGTSAIYVVTDIREDCYMLDDKDISLLFKTQDQWELVPNKFDITTLKPFESKVLVRTVENQFWRPAIWGVKHCDWDYYCVLGGDMWEQCIPYEGNEHLLGNTDDCDEYYKTWK